MAVAVAGAAALSSIDRMSTIRFVESLNAKRLADARKALPLTAQALGETFGRRCCPTLTRRRPRGAIAPMPRHWSRTSRTLPAIKPLPGGSLSLLVTDWRSSRPRRRES